ncbi:hypothetical protein BE21_57475 [Sorangium cellulosum]|uniref:Uncharacterized protein n=1 Tax=Sorangium cellulosum TaxID=56 RepID=A0A150U375_SORCE|nr:hypothetical protein BE21_57475 [Sorangium cellulosum]
MALVDYIESILPGWMSRDDTAHWVQFGLSVAAMIDAVTEIAFEGRLAAMPIQVDSLPFLGGFMSVDALPLVGRDRRLVKGPRETWGMYALRLRRWQRTHREAGTVWGMLDHLANLLAPDAPKLRIVTDQGIWFTRDTDGTFTMHTPAGTGLSISKETGVSAVTAPAHPWDWDSANTGQTDRHGTDDGKARAWLIIYATGSSPIVDTEGTWGDGTTNYGDTDGTIGTSATPELVDTITGTVKLWKTAGIYIPWVIVAFDPNSFNPETAGPYPAAGMPDGTWHRAGKLVGGSYVRTRLSTARYMRGTPR